MKSFFTFSKGEQRGIFVLLGIIIIIICLNFLITRPSDAPSSSHHIEAWETEVIAFEEQQKIMDHYKDSLRTAQKAQREAHFKNYYSYSFPDEIPQRIPPEYFFFDPNTASITDFTKLGFSQKQAEAIERYRNKGAIFKEKSDFSKVFVVSEEMFSILEPWIVISTTDTTTMISSTVPEKSFLLFELNSCDTAQLRLLKGIGSVLAQKIVHYRTKLGGYYSIDQLSEINGIQQEVLKDISQHLTVDATLIKKIDLNMATFKQLLQHPYFEYHIVKNIFSYKDKNGNFKSEEQLKDIPLMYEELFNKIRPYITVKQHLI